MGNETETRKLVTRGLRLEYFTLLWNVLGICITAVAAWKSHSIAIAGFGLDSLIEIGASTVVIWELTSTNDKVRPKALRIIGVSFFGIAAYIFLQVLYLLINRSHPDVSVLGIVWTAITFLTMFALAKAKARTGTQLHNPVLITEGKVTMIDAYLAASVMVGLLLNATLHWWWADLASALIIVYYGLKEGRAALLEAKHHS